MLHFACLEEGGGELNTSLSAVPGQGITLRVTAQAEEFTTTFTKLRLTKKFCTGMVLLRNLDVNDYIEEQERKHSKTDNAMKVTRPT